MKKVILISILVITVLFIFWPENKNLQITNPPLQIEVADTDAERVKGLSGRESLPANTGLLFVFEKPDKYGIWMKDMNFAIDIAWLNTNKKIILIESNVTPATYPKVFYPPTEVLYVLEVNSGFFASHSIEAGDTLETKGD